MRISILIVLLFLKHVECDMFDEYNKIGEQLGSSICKNESKGGMFGYSLTMSSAPFKQLENPWNYLAVGHPWESSVEIYALPKMNSSSGNETNMYASQELIKVQTLGDQGNGTWPKRAYSLFGYSVSITEDGEWLAVGVPGRTFSRPDDTIDLQFHSYAGCVRLYRIQRNNVSEIPSKFKFVTEIKNPNGNRFWQKFGSKVVMLSRFKQNSREWALFISANAGWDGASTKFFAAKPNSDKWPIEPRSVVGAGIYVYRLSDDNKIQRLSFIPQRSTVPLGSLGLDFDVAVDNDSSHYHIMMRDFVAPKSEIDIFNAHCPLNNCSYVYAEDELGNRRLVNAVGSVVHYEIAISDGSHKLLEILQKRDFEAFMQSQTDMTVNADSAPTFSESWLDDDWFGIGISLTFDRSEQKYVLVIGAPRGSKGVYIFSSTNMRLWVPSSFISNPSPSSRSFYGQRVKLSPDGGFLLVSDPVDDRNEPGGKVYIYRRRSEYEILPNYTDIVRLPSGFPIVYDFLKTLYFNHTIGSQYGFSIDVTDYFFITGTHVGECVFLESQPLVVELMRPSPPSGSDYPSTPNYPANTESMSMQILILIVVGGLCGILCGSLVFVLLYRRHKQRILRQLSEKGVVYTGSQKSLDSISSQSPLISE